MSTTCCSPENVIDGVVADDLCVGCGLCAGVCPTECLTMEANRKGDLQVAMKGECNSCDLCLKVCPFYEQDVNIDLMAENLFGRQEQTSHKDILGYFRSCWVGHVNSDGDRENSASGGLATKLLGKLFEDGTIDAVGLVHTETIDQRYCHFTCARTVEEIQRGSGSAYYPVEISNVIREIMKTDERWAVVALPCLAYALRLAQSCVPKLKRQIKYILSLTCGMLMNDYFTEFLLSKAAVSRERVTQVKYRSKCRTGSASDYCFEAFDGRGRYGKAVLMSGRPNRMWAGGFFRMNSCNFCEDVFGETADICFMDAWLPQYIQDPKGTSITIVRNPGLEPVLQELQKEGEIEIGTICPKDILTSQTGAINHKRKLLPLRLHRADKAGHRYPPRRCVAERRNLRRRILCSVHHRIQNTSKFLWPRAGRYFGWRVFLVTMWPFCVPLNAYPLLAKLKRTVLSFAKRNKEN